MNFKPDYFVDLQWLHNISHRFEKFKSTSATTNVFNCRCPICGDSYKNKSKARFYFYTKQHALNTICHNCGYSHSFWTFMKDVCPNEFDEYKRDQMKARLDDIGNVSSNRSAEPIVTIKQDEKPSQASTQTSLDGTEKVLDLPLDHPARAYLKSRGFGQREMSRLLWSDDFKLTANSISQEELSEDFPSDGRIIIPFYNESGHIEMIQGRSLSNKGLRYLSIKSHPDVDKIYGKYEVDRSKTVYCVEGPFDSLFVDNCLATCDANLTRAKADVYVFDNQPRSPDIVKIMRRTIDAGYSVVVWPTSPDGKEDINDMILSGTTRSQLMSILKRNTVKGPMALLAFNRWRKV